MLQEIQVRGGGGGGVVKKRPHPFGGGGVDFFWNNPIKCLSLLISIPIVIHHHLHHQLEVCSVKIVGFLVV